MAEENIFLFVPNLIGYVRIVLALLALYFMPSNPVPAVCSYLLSTFLDSLDGHAARALNQGTQFGAMLDMLTDRCVTMCLLVNLSMLYPQYAFLFQLSMSLDIASHWLHLHSSTMKGSASHKAIDLSGNPILRIYYTSRTTLFVMCSGNELFYCLLYLLHFIEEPHVSLLWLLYISAPICLLKTGISVVHLVTASRNLAALDCAERAQKRLVHKD
ncbi:CDP-diacylglycerol--inositol 3-phosphatidyltransferase [Amia ocellicauda]|uniref:CDP-diacylglycerol--inositol 3-phosphatidyltransferase n=1 Tax=Amia ocellicauda TaxID=2972642 RepID=UPI0034642723